MVIKLIPKKSVSKSGIQIKKPKSFNLSLTQARGPNKGYASCYCYGPAYPPCSQAESGKRGGGKITPAFFLIPY